MNAVHIVGKKNHGKTTLVVALAEVLTKRGLCVGTLKHCHQVHELDTPGKDTHRHRLAGAAVVAAFTPTLTAVFHRRNGPYDAYDALRDEFDGCDIVLVEGGAAGPGPKMEVWRAERGTVPLAAELEGIAAVVTDEESALRAVCQPALVLARAEVSAVANHALKLAREV